MSIGVRAIEKSKYSYEIAALSHPGEILQGIARISPAMANRILTPELPILLFDGHTMMLSQKREHNISVLAGKSSLAGGVYIRTPDEYRVGINEYFAGYGLLIFGFINMQDLLANYNLLPRITSDEVRTGSW